MIVGAVWVIALDGALRQSLEAFLRASRLPVMTFETADEAIGFRSSSPACVIVDEQGLACRIRALSALSQQFPAAPLIVLATQGAGTLGDRVFVLEKPFAAGELEAHMVTAGQFSRRL